jgi:hypothetical protein
VLVMVCRPRDVEVFLLSTLSAYNSHKCPLPRAAAIDFCLGSRHSRDDLAPYKKLLTRLGQSLICCCRPQGTALRAWHDAFLIFCLFCVRLRLDPSPAGRRIPVFIVRCVRRDAFAAQICVRFASERTGRAIVFSSVCVRSVPKLTHMSLFSPPTSLSLSCLSLGLSSSPLSPNPPTRTRAHSHAPSLGAALVGGELRR